MALADLSDKQLERLICRVHDRITDKFAGGGPYGWDLPTLRVCYPSWCWLWLSLKSEWLQRNPERSKA